MELRGGVDQLRGGLEELEERMEGLGEVLAAAGGLEGLALVRARCCVGRRKVLAGTAPVWRRLA